MVWKCGDLVVHHYYWGQANSEWITICGVMGMVGEVAHIVFYIQIFYTHIEQNGSNPRLQAPNT